MREVEIYNINDKEYMLLKKVEKATDTYLYFSSIEEGNDYIIRKIDPTNPEMLIPLDSEDEVKKAILLLTNKSLEA